MRDFLYDDFFHLEQNHWWFIGRRKIILSLIDHHNKQVPCRILDAGCGTGYTALALSRYGKVSALDPSEAALDYVKQRGIESVKQGSMTAIPYPSETFDIVTALDVLEHIEDDRSSIAELCRVLRPAGILVITVPAFNFLWSPHDDINLHKRRYTAAEIRNKIESSGLKIHKLSYFNFFLFPAILLVRFFRKAFPAPNEEAKSDFSIFNQGFINTMLQKILSAESKLLIYFNFPCGLSLVCVAKKL
jgi:ubiquinone/menaquinone biosynthesis C-methylase UbiE